MEIELTYDPDQKRLYLKEDIARVLGEKEKKIIGLANFKTVLLYPQTADYESILNSLEVLKLDLIGRKKEQDRLNSSRTPP